jgi:glycerol-3-phosphate dehydrogenase
MLRQQIISQFQQTPSFDIVIIGGGATGLGAALDAITRGYSTLLIEAADFGKGTSSRSTKLVHGGVRYLAQGNIKLVREALHERGRLLKNAVHVTSIQPFVVPVYSLWDKLFYGIGLMVYDILSGNLSLGKTKWLDKKTTTALLPGIETKKLFGGVLYYDGQFNDSRLCIDLATTAMAKGAVLVNYCSVIEFHKTNGKITAITCKDQLNNKQYTIQAKSVINATGVFTDAILALDEPGRDKLVSPSQGIHLVIHKHFFPGDHAMMIPKTDDGRVFFVVPWLDKMVLGTTDTGVDTIAEEPIALEEEIEFVINHFNRYAAATIQRSDILSVFAGLRPLVKMKGTASTALLSRDHTLLISNSGLVTITGGKWTTYRKMAQDAIDNAIFSAKLEKKGGCVTKELPIGDERSKERRLKEIEMGNTSLSELLVEDYSIRLSEISYAVRYELAVTVEDFLARRTRLLFLDAQLAIQVAPVVAEIMANEMGMNKAWIGKQIESFNLLAQQYLVA